MKLERSNRKQKVIGRSVGAVCLTVTTMCVCGCVCVCVCVFVFLCSFFHSQSVSPFMVRSGGPRLLASYEVEHFVVVEYISPSTGGQL